MKQMTHYINQSLFLSQGILKKGSVVELLSVRLDDSFSSGIAVKIKALVGSLVNEVIVEVDSGYFSSIS